MRHTGQEAWRCGEVAGRFQLKHRLLEAVVKSLSGGYQTRAKVTAMLLRNPNFLVLDEPSNYLDLKTLILWRSSCKTSIPREGLKGQPGAF